MLGARFVILIFDRFALSGPPNGVAGGARRAHGYRAGQRLVTVRFPIDG
jgi:hypothetical protein